MIGAAVGLHFGDRVAALRQIADVLDAGIGEIAAGHLHAAFQQMADQRAGAHARHVGSVPAEAVRERREEHRRVGETAADDHVGVGVERGDDRVGAEIGVHADHRHVDVGERAGLVHEGLIGRHQRGHVVAFDAGDLQALEAELARDDKRALGRRRADWPRPCW